MSNQWRALGVLLTVFVLGIATGGGAVAAYHGNVRQRAAREMWGPHPNRPMLMLMRRLGLTADQRDAMEKILLNHEPKRRAIMRAMTEQCGQELAREKSELDRELRSVLNPEQQVRFDELSEQQRERFFGRGHPPPSRQ
jgi:Spy/CpxP family protein refolding chaperone